MAFDSFSDFIAMGKHGPYVWFCYGLTLLIVLGLVWHVRNERARFFRDQAAQMRRESARHTSAFDEDSDDASQA